MSDLSWVKVKTEIKAKHPQLLRPPVWVYSRPTLHKIEWILSCGLRWPQLSSFPINIFPSSGRHFCKRKILLLTHNIVGFVILRSGYDMYHTTKCNWLVDQLSRELWEWKTVLTTFFIIFIFCSSSKTC